MKPKKITYVVPDFYSEELQLAILKSTEETINKCLSKLPDVERITTSICRHFNVEIDDILVEDRSDEIIYKRQMLFYFLYHYSGLTASHIGCIGKVKFSDKTIYYSAKVIKEMQYSSEVRKDIETIRELIEIRT